jgi:hypothetical protein
MASILGLQKPAAAPPGDSSEQAGRPVTPPESTRGEGTAQAPANSPKNILERIPFLAGALAALVRSSDKEAEGGELSDADTRTREADSPEVDVLESLAAQQSPQQSPPRYLPRPLVSNPAGRVPSSESDEESLLESSMVLALVQSPSRPSAEAIDSNESKPSANWRLRVDRRKPMHGRAHSSSPTRTSKMIHADDDVSVAKLAVLERMSSGGLAFTRNRRERGNVGDPLALSDKEQMQHAKMREDIVRNFAKHIDNLEIGEKLRKATGDLGQNLGKAGDKLMKVWDLNDLKDDTIEMGQHYEEDIKEDLGKRVQGAHEAVGKAKNIAANVGEHLRNTGRVLQSMQSMGTPRPLEQASNIGEQAQIACQQASVEGTDGDAEREEARSGAGAAGSMRNRTAGRSRSPVLRPEKS